MKKPVHILLPEEQIEDLHYQTDLPKNTYYTIQDARVRSWQYPDFSLCEQYYDARDAFICLAELNCHTPVDIGIRCEVADIFWLYQLEGSYTILDPTKDLNIVLNTQAQHYTQVYVPQQSYICRFPKGHHLLFYFVIQPKWLQRQGARAMEGFNHLLKKHHEKHAALSHNGLLPINPPVREQLLSLFTLPKMKSMLREIKIYEHCFNLLDLSQEDLHLHGEHIVEGDYHLAVIRAYIAKQIKVSQLPTLEHIATSFKMNIHNLRKQHKKTYGYTLREYIYRKKMELAATLLIQESISITEITYRLDYGSAQSFHKSFYQYYGMSARMYRSRFKSKQ